MDAVAKPVQASSSTIDPVVTEIVPRTNRACSGQG